MLSNRAIIMPLMAVKNAKLLKCKNTKRQHTTCKTFR